MGHGLCYRGIQRTTHRRITGQREYITPGAPRPLFNAICAGCHGSISGAEPDVAVSADALTGASASVSRDMDPALLR